MADTDIPVCLVDGVGRPRVLYLPYAEVLPDILRFPHQGVKVTSGATQTEQVLVQFERTAEHDAYGRQVYRQRGTGTPPLRDAYFVLPESL